MSASNLTGSTPPSPPQILFDEGDVERQLVWHQNRLQSRLDAHQRRVIADLARFHRSDLYKLSAVRVVGGHHTRPEFLSEIFGPILGDGDERTLPEILKSSDELHDRLAKLGIFSHLQVSLAPDKDEPRGIEALVNVIERGRFFLKTSTDVGNGEGALTGLARARNVCGRAEVLEASVGLGNKTRASCQLRAEAPLWAARARAELAVNASERDLSGFASCNETVKSVAAKLKTETGYGAHEISYELATRTIGSLLPGASDSIRQAAAIGPNVKSAVTLSWIRDTRDQSVFPTKGSLLKIVQEYAGLFGQANYMKSTLESAISRPLFNTATIVSLGFQCGFMHPMGGRESLFNDRFQLGGPTNVRMFHMNSLGPKDRNDYLGGEKYWAGGLSILAPLPGKSDWPLKLHGFINAGSLLNDLQTLKSQKPSIGIGLGLVGSIQDVRVEANVGMPLVAQKSDGARRGLQVGLGIGFLS
ncbi:hypothetical protein KEM48_012559 [Puccinia striiformis f. sp. tritici PST-130]|nr:hypothetical protein Pst134EB_025206 [Puccinia striiformis f. sp. tritici]KAI9629833.1 hypothetical protein KEM48_012559 [Puccinia striiformis f. sp. tritici PST-130]